MEQTESAITTTNSGRKLCLARLLKDYAFLSLMPLWDQTDEAVFLLRGQDIVAPMAIKMWVRMNAMVAEKLVENIPLEQAVAEVEKHFFLDGPIQTYGDHKMEGALAIAQAMEEYEARRSAD